ncbi:probable multidrug resistance-associated protein lethal(2)03659 isoform X2 [Tribolium madens]|uniref:probable multidrug resistance-associated protein lethal(2)03659 isoform X2 n=1 Tax=Tribolium madens TaxID=41895 RepID=UPI001CF7336B|nr:probable multidrug resistance-associated protein lethal(2)03659 isoform X2 [Tribolium madens]
MKHRKTVKPQNLLKKTSLQKVTTGQLINLMSNDVSTFDNAIIFLHFVWFGLVELIIGTYFINVTIGPGATSGILVMLICFLFQTYIAKYTASNRKRVASSTDYRIQLLNDLICGIQIIKMYAWEKPFKKLVEIARNLELTEISKTNRLFVLNDSFNYVLIQIIIFVGILGAILLHTPITSQYVFAMANIYGHLRITLTIFAPLGILHFGELRTSILRIQEFLLTDNENSKKNALVHKTEKTISGISVTDLCVKWDNSQNDFVLKNITLSATCGQLIGIVGPAGSGKSALLQTIIDETEVISGKFSVNGRIAYASQEAWIFSASVKQNILFGEEMDEEKYQKVVKVCALEHDLALLPYGDNTLVGERGVMLSGGQKARINLARSVYRDADIYLLDDPLSAVDAHVGQIIFKNCIRGYLKNKCVILVTHQLTYLQEATNIYSLKNGRLYCNEHFDKIFEYNSDNAPNDKDLVIKSNNEYSVLPSKTKEVRGNLKMIKIYKSYFTVGGKSLFFFVIFIFFLLQYTTNGLDYFTSFWLNVEQGSMKLESQVRDFFSYENFLIVYSCILLILLLLIFIYSWAFVKYIKNASTYLHNEMLAKVLNADLSFFHNNSDGRILNRFSMDMGSVDQKVPLQLIWILPTLMSCLGTCVLISILNFWMIFPTIALFPIYYCLGVVFQPTVKGIKRTEGITRSPVYSHLTATLQGLTTIKAFGAQNILQEEFEKHQNIHSSALHTVIGIYALIGFIAEFISVLYTTVVSFAFFLFGKGAYIGNVGLAIHLAIQLTGLVGFLMRIWSSLDSEITSVERILDYTKLSQETGGKQSPPKTWPSEGRISFQSVSLRYSSTEPPVLKNVNFTIEPGEKIGIIGRTGAGKSSLVSTLFHLFHFEGTIFIDNVDTKSITLQDLRSKISVIPQDPVLFLGTLRKNLDPFDEFSDAQLWSALEDVEMKSVIPKLESEVSERGSNFSVGQKQLLCLVRAMLRNNKIVVLDEATANIDFETDELIQSAIRRKFQNSTVLTIAHRLNTVLDSDKILVMNDGVAVEFGSPMQLLEDINSYFYQNYMQDNRNHDLEKK